MTTMHSPNALLSENPTIISHAPEKSDQVRIDFRDHLNTHQDPNNPFAFVPEQLSALVDPKNMPLLRAYGGLEGVARGLHVDLKSGLIPNAPKHQPITLEQVMTEAREESVLERTPTVHSLGARQLTHRTDITTTDITAFPQRRRVFGANVLPETTSKNIFQLMWIAFQDKTLVNRTNVLVHNSSKRIIDLVGDCGRCLFGRWFV